MLPTITFSDDADLDGFVTVMGRLIDFVFTVRYVSPVTGETRFQVGRLYETAENWLGFTSPVDDGFRWGIHADQVVEVEYA